MLHTLPDLHALVECILRGEGGRLLAGCPALGNLAESSCLDEVTASLPMCSPSHVHLASLLLYGPPSAQLGGL